VRWPVQKAISVEDGGGTNNKLVWPGGGGLFVSFLGISDGFAFHGDFNIS